MLSHVQLFVTALTVGHQAPLSMEFSRQEYWSGLPFSTPRDLPNPGIEPTYLASPAFATVPLRHYIYLKCHFETHLFLLSIWKAKERSCLNFVNKSFKCHKFILSCAQHLLMFWYIILNMTKAEAYIIKKHFKQLRVYYALFFKYFLIVGLNGKLYINYKKFD